MRKPLIAATLVTAGVFSTGYMIGQLQGPIPVNAASKHAGTGSNPITRAQASGTATPKARHADGAVTAVNGNTITVKPDNDQAGSDEYTQVTTIVLTSSTTFKGGTTRASIVAGVPIVAEGTVSGDGKTLTATSVGVGGHAGHRGGQGGPHADGSVVGITGNTVTVKPDTDPTGSNEYTRVTTVLLTGSTTYGSSSTRASIVAGAQFDAEGTVSSDGTTLTATRFNIRGTGAHQRGG